MERRRLGAALVGAQACIDASEAHQTKHHRSRRAAARKMRVHADRLPPPPFTHTASAATAERDTKEQRIFGADDRHRTATPQFRPSNTLTLAHTMKTPNRRLVFVDG